MTLKSIKESLQRASQEGFAVPLFNIFDANAVDGVLAAVEANPGPCILGVYSGCFKEKNIEAFTAYIQKRASQLAFPIAMMLDHGDSADETFYAMDLGYTDVMFDGSKLSVEENIEISAKIVEKAHPLGVGVEAELGHVGMGSSYGDFGAKRLGFTDPDIVETFIQKSGVDYLAIAFGNAHGEYRSEPRLDLDLVRTIHARVSTPLVMHGGSGLDDDQYRAVVTCGIAKINYFTGISKAAAARMTQTAEKGNAVMLDFTAALREAYADTCQHYMDVFGAGGKY
ncbi:MAG: class II fructose-bisphosphate aldolase [Anaerolineae bacterium]|nr:class II fructose-bisphosphate aldolase [Anaerolineae bacterium]